MISKELSTTLGFAVREAKKEGMNMFVLNTFFMQSLTMKQVPGPLKNVVAVQNR